MNKIFIVGTGGAGKTTLAKGLAAHFGIESYELDNLFWNDNWRVSSSEEFLSRVARITSNSSWVIDGNYRGPVFDVVYNSSDTLIWLNLPRRLVIWRCALRSMRMLVMKQKFYDKELPSSFMGCIKHLKFVWVTFNERNLYLRERVEKYVSTGKTAIVLNSQKEIDRFYARKTETIYIFKPTK